MKDFKNPGVSQGRKTIFPGACSLVFAIGESKQNLSHFIIQSTAKTYSQPDSLRYQENVASLFGREILTKLSTEKYFVHGKSIFAYKARLRNLVLVSFKHETPGGVQGPVPGLQI